MIKPQPIWHGDLLKRKGVADYLTNYLVERYKAKKDEEQGFVLAVNADWGFGKTYMLKNWVSQLQQSGYAAVYFDAWQNDFTSEPLVAFIAEIDESLKPIFKNIPAAKKYLSQTLSKAKQLWKPAGKALGGILVKRVIGISTEEIGDLLQQNSSEDSQKDKWIRQEIIDSFSKAYESTLEDHVNKKQAISGFLNKLSLLIKSLESSEKVKLPLFFFIDELDRCRPDYAIELLEAIKHLFGVPGIYFIIATNLNQLGESTKAIYGPGFEGGRYLKRFFDLEYSLPPPDDPAAFAQALFDSSAIEDQNVFITGLSKEFYGDKHQASKLFALYSQFFGLGLRDQQHVMRHIEAAVAAKRTPRVHAHYIFFLSMLNYKFPQSFEQIVEWPKSESDLKIEITKLRKKDISIKSRGSGSNGKEKSTNLIEIVRVYLQAARKDLREIFNHGENIDEYDFPQNLNLEIGKEMPDSSEHGKFLTPSIAEYPKLVREAGHFR